MPIHEWLVDTGTKSVGQGTMTATWGDARPAWYTMGNATLNVGGLVCTVTIGPSGATWMEGNQQCRGIYLFITLSGPGVEPPVSESYQVGTVKYAYYDDYANYHDTEWSSFPTSCHISMGFPCRLMCLIREEPWHTDYIDSVINYDEEGNPTDVTAIRKAWTPQRDSTEDPSWGKPIPDGKNFLSADFEWYAGFPADGNGAVHVTCGEVDWSYDLGAWTGDPQKTDKDVTAEVYAGLEAAPPGEPPIPIGATAGSRSVTLDATICGSPIPCTSQTGTVNLPTTNVDSAPTPDWLSGSVSPGHGTATCQRYVLNNQGVQFGIKMHANASRLWDVQGNLYGPFGAPYPKNCQNAQCSIVPFNGPETVPPFVNSLGNVVHDDQYKVMDRIPAVEAPGTYAGFRANYDLDHQTDTCINRVTGRWIAQVRGDVHSTIGNSEYDQSAYAVNQDQDQAGGVNAVGFVCNSLTDADADANAWRARMEAAPYFYWKALRFTYRPSFLIEDFRNGADDWTLGEGTSGQITSSGYLLASDTNCIVKKLFAASNGERDAWFDQMAAIAVTVTADEKDTEVVMSLGGKTWTAMTSKSPAEDTIVFDLLRPDSVSSNPDSSSQTIYERYWSGGAASHTEGDAWWGVECIDQTLTITVKAKAALVNTVYATIIDGWQDVQVGTVVSTDDNYKTELTHPTPETEVQKVELPVLRHIIDGRLEAECTGATLDDDTTRSELYSGDAPLDPNPYEYFPAGFSNINDVYRSLVPETLTYPGRGSTPRGMVYVENLAPDPIGSPVVLTPTFSYYTYEQFCSNAHSSEHLSERYYHAETGATASVIEIWAHMSFDRVQFGPGLGFPLRIEKVAGYGIQALEATPSGMADTRSITVLQGTPEVDIDRQPVTLSHPSCSKHGRAELLWYRPDLLKKGKDVKVKDTLTTASKTVQWGRVGEIRRLGMLVSPGFLGAAATTDHAQNNIVAWSQSSTIYAATVRYGAVTRSLGAICQGNNPCVVYLAYRGGYADIYFDYTGTVYVTRGNRVSWGTPMSICLGTRPVAIGEPSTQTVYLFYLNGGNLYMRVRSASGAFGSEKTVALGVGDSAPAAVVENGRRVGVRVMYADASGHILSKVSYDKGETWA